MQYLQRLYQLMQYAYAAFGNNQLRVEWLKKLKTSGYKNPTLFHSTAYVSL